MVNWEIGERFFQICTIATSHEIHEGTSSYHGGETFVGVFDEIGKFGLAVEGAHLVNFHDGGEGSLDCSVEVFASETVVVDEL